MIKFIYFDVGGVAIKDFSATDKWQKMKKDIGVKPECDKEFDNLFDEYESKMCMGQDSETLIPIIEKGFDIKFPNNYSLLKDFVNRFEKNESIWLAIKEAKNKSKIGLLTNMYPGMLGLIRERGLAPSVEWDLVIDSSVEGMAKPQEEIYNLAQKRAQVDASEILFIENTQENITAAERLGWQTFFYDSKDYNLSSANLEKYLKHLSQA